MRKRPVCIYVDNSNIFIGGQEAAKARNENPESLRLAFLHFLYLITRGDMEFEELVWAGSGPPELEEVFKTVTDRGVDLQLIPRSASGENETVDHTIQLSMYRHHRKYRHTPGTIVLCTGDGKGFHEEKGFLYDVQGFIQDGWDLNLYSWDAICHNGLKRFAKRHGIYVPLEKYYYSITFIKNGRPAEEVRLRNKRPAAKIIPRRPVKKLPAKKRPPQQLPFPPKPAINPVKRNPVEANPVRRKTVKRKPVKTRSIKRRLY
jgi:hypothetical protein